MFFLEVPKFMNYSNIFLGRGVDTYEVQLLGRSQARAKATYFIDNVINNCSVRALKPPRPPGYDPDVRSLLLFMSM